MSKTARGCRASETASGDPAMAFDLPSILPGIARLVFSAASLPNWIAVALRRPL